MTEEKPVSRIYTRTGDKGKTSLIGGTLVSKADPRLDVYGTVDELNSVVGLTKALLTSELTASGLDVSDQLRELNTVLDKIQRELFNVGSQLACEDPEVRLKLPTLADSNIKELEERMDTWTRELAPLKNFILPGGSACAAQAHIARTVCRRAERLFVHFLLEETLDTANSGGQSATDAVIVQYLNRLSDLFFVLARHLNRLLNIEEPIWAAGQS